MSHYNQQPSAPEAVTVSAHPEAGPYVSAQPPMGYPTKDASVGYPQQSLPTHTAIKGDGFWKGCLAAICCCCVLDCCCF